MTFRSSGAGRVVRCSSACLVVFQIACGSGEEANPNGVLGATAGTVPTAGLAAAGSAGSVAAGSAAVAGTAAPATAGTGMAAAGTGVAGSSDGAGVGAAGTGVEPVGGTAAQAGSAAEAGSAGSTSGTGAQPDPLAPDPSPGCSGGTIVAGHSEATIQIGSRQREYVQHVPSTYDGTKPFAVLIDFHGGTYDGPRWDARPSNKFKDMAETEHFIYLAPTGLNAWWTTTDGADGDDGQFMRALIDELKQNACVDNRRFYTTGCSMGGDMSFYMACYFSDVIAASLPMCGTMAFPLTDCQPTRPISVQFNMGSRDSLNCWEPPRTSVGNPCASEVLDTFKALNGCTDAAEETQGGLCMTHDECEGGTEASICLLNATHTGIYQASDMDVYVEGWNFLKRYVLPL